MRTPAESHFASQWMRNSRRTLSGSPAPRPHQSKGSAQQSFSLGQRLPHALGVEPFDLQHLRRRGVAADDGDRS